MNSNVNLDDSFYETKVTTQGRKYSTLNYVYDLDKYVEKYFHVEHHINQGSFGQVYQLQDKKKQKKYAVKMLKQTEAYETEIEIFSLLNQKSSEHIIRLYEVLIEDTFQKGCFIMELADCDLHGYQLRKKKFSFTELRNIFRQILLGLEVCHQNGIVHADLKPENILVFGSDAQRICLGDFGSSYRFCNEEDDPQSGLTLLYQPAEMLLNDDSESVFHTSIDIWSCCMIMLKLIHKKYICYERTKIGMIFQIFQFFGTPKKNSFLRTCEYWTDEFPNFPKKETFWRKEVHPFFRRILTPMCDYDPDQRPSVKELLLNFL